MEHTRDTSRDCGRRDSEQTRGLSRYPICYHCGELIKSDFALVSDGKKYICEDCETFYTDDYIKED